MTLSWQNYPKPRRRPTKDKHTKHAHRQLVATAIGEAGGISTATAPKLSTKKYLKELSRLQGELCKLQDWAKATGDRAIVVFEGRDAAGKGGSIRAITERVSPRVFRVVALPAP